MLQYLHVHVVNQDQQVHKNQDLQVQEIQDQQVLKNQDHQVENEIQENLVNQVKTSCLHHQVSHLCPTTLPLLLLSSVIPKMCSDIRIAGSETVLPPLARWAKSEFRLLRFASLIDFPKLFLTFFFFVLGAVPPPLLQDGNSELGYKIFDLDGGWNCVSYAPSVFTSIRYRLPPSSSLGSEFSCIWLLPIECNSPSFPATTSD